MTLEIYFLFSGEPNLIHVFTFDSKFLDFYT